MSESESNVQYFRDGGTVLAPGTPRPALIEDLEKMLEMARSGEIEGIAYAAVLRTDATIFYAVGKMSRSIIGTLAVLQTKLCNDDLED